MFQGRQLSRFLLTACEEDILDDIKRDGIDPFKDGESILFWNKAPEFMQRFVEIVRLFEDWDVEFIHKCKEALIMRMHTNVFARIVSLENIFSAWEEFYKDKKKKLDVQEFEFELEKHLFQLHRELRSGTYEHGPYSGFYIQDPKLRHIHKATVRDRILHHAIFKILNPMFEPTFIANSFSCRIGKGSHKGVLEVERMLRKESRNNTRPCFALKCDVRRFFDSVDHRILLGILEKRIADPDAMRLITEIIGSYTSSDSNLFEKRGVPIGNLTSQLFANVYMNEFDQFMKHQLKVSQYVRYTDDFIIVSESREYLEKLLPLIREFLWSKLLLELHPKKVEIRKFSQGIDFLGYVILPHYRLLRTKTKQRVFRKVKERSVQYRQGIISITTLHQSLQSYLGTLSHASAYQLSEKLKISTGFGCANDAGP